MGRYDGGRLSFEKWIFSEITRTSFRWHAEESGTTENLGAYREKANSKKTTAGVVRDRQVLKEISSSAVDQQSLSGNESRFVTGEEQYDIRYITRFTDQP